MKYYYNGEMLTPPKIAKKAEVSLNSLRKYLKQGFSAKESINIIKTNKKRVPVNRGTIYWNGKYFSYKDMEKITGKSAFFIKNKLQQGFTIEEIKKMEGVHKGPKETEDFKIPNGRKVGNYITKSLDEMIANGMKRDNPYITY